MTPETIRELAIAAGNAYNQSPPNGATILIDAIGQDRGFMVSDSKGVLIAIRGTCSLNDAKIDAEIIQEHEEGGNVHYGFWNEYCAIKYQVDQFIKAHKGKLVRVCGHSLGAAIATFIAEQAYLDGDAPVQLLTLGSPRVGDRAFAEHFDRLRIDMLRIVHGYDLIARVPKFEYYHVGVPLHIDDEGHPMKFGFLGVLWGWITKKSLSDHHVMGYLVSLERYLKGCP